MAKTSPKSVDQEAKMRSDVRTRLEAAISFQELIGEGAVQLDALADHFLNEDIKAGANIQAADWREWETLKAKLPSDDLRHRFIQYVDDIEARSMYYAEAGYEIGLEVGRSLRLRADGAR